MSLPCLSPANSIVDAANEDHMPINDAYADDAITDDANTTTNASPFLVVHYKSNKAVIRSRSPSLEPEANAISEIGQEPLTEEHQVLEPMLLGYSESTLAYTPGCAIFQGPGATRDGTIKLATTYFFTFDPATMPLPFPRYMVSEVGSAQNEGKAAGPTLDELNLEGNKEGLGTSSGLKSYYPFTLGPDCTAHDSVNRWLIDQEFAKNCRAEEERHRAQELVEIVSTPGAACLTPPIRRQRMGRSEIGVAKPAARLRTPAAGAVQPAIRLRTQAPGLRRRLNGSDNGSNCSSLSVTKSLRARMDRLKSVSQCGPLTEDGTEEDPMLEMVLANHKALGAAEATVSHADEKLKLVTAAQAARFEVTQTEADAAAKITIAKKDVVIAQKDAAAILAQKEAIAKLKEVQKDAAAILAQKEATAKLKEAQKEATAKLKEAQNDAAAKLAQRDAAAKLREAQYQVAQKEANAKLTAAQYQAAEDRSQKLLTLANMQKDLVIAQEKAARLEAERTHLQEMAKLREENARKEEASATTHVDRKAAATERTYIQATNDVALAKHDLERNTAEADCEKMKKAMDVLRIATKKESEEQKKELRKAQEDVRDYKMRVEKQEETARTLQMQLLLLQGDAKKAANSALKQQERQRSQSEPRKPDEAPVKISTEPRLSPVPQEAALPKTPPQFSPRRSLSIAKPVAERRARADREDRRERSSLDSSELNLGEDAQSYHASRQTSKRSQRGSQAESVTASALGILRLAVQEQQKAFANQQELLATQTKLLADQRAELERVRNSPRKSRSPQGRESPTALSSSTPIPGVVPAPVHDNDLLASGSSPVPKSSRTEEDIAELKEKMKEMRTEMANSRRRSSESTPKRRPRTPITSRLYEQPQPLQQASEEVTALLKQVVEQLQQQPGKKVSPPPTVIFNGSFMDESPSEPTKQQPASCAAAHDPRSVVVNAQPIQLSQISNFAGHEDGITFAEWIKRFDRVLNLSPAGANPVMKAKILPTKLTGTALVAYESQEPAVQDDYEASKAALKDWFNYKTKNEYPHWLKYSQRRGELVQQYAARLQRAQMDAVGTEANSASNQLQLKQVFLEGLKKELRLKVMDMVPEGWKPTVDRARYLERVMDGDSGAAAACITTDDYEDYVSTEDECAAIGMDSTVGSTKMIARALERAERLEKENVDLKDLLKVKIDAEIAAHEAEEKAAYDEELEAAAKKAYYSTVDDARRMGAPGYTGSRGARRGFGSSAGRGGYSRADADRDWRGPTRTFERTRSSSVDSRPTGSTGGRGPTVWTPGSSLGRAPSGPICDYCKGAGHIKRYCRKREDHIKELNDERTKRVMAAAERKAIMPADTTPVKTMAITSSRTLELLPDDGEWEANLHWASRVNRLPEKYWQHYDNILTLPTLYEDEIWEADPPPDNANTVASVHTKLSTSRMFVDVTLNEKPLNALIDTGASISIISAKAARKCIPKEAIEKTAQSCQSASDHDIPLSGRAMVTIKVGNKAYEQRVYISEGFVNDLLLGDDWIVKAECSLVYRQNKRMMIIDGQQVKTKTGLVSNDVQAVYQVALINQFRVPGRTMSSISFQLPAKDSGEPMQLEEGELVYVQPMRREAFDSDVTLPKCVTRVQDGVISVPVMNVSTAPVSVPKGAYLMQVESFDPDIQSIQEVEMPEPKELDPGVHERASEAFTKKVHEWVAMGLPVPELPGISFVESDLTEEQKTMFAFALSTVRGAFAEDDLELGMTKDVAHDIDTGSTPPIRQQPYRVPLHYRAEMEQLLKDMLKQGVIEPSHSPWASPVVLVKKKDGKLRFCVDFRKVNAVTRKDSYPLPRIDELLDSLSLAKFFTSIDLQSGFWQIPMTKAARSKTAFTCHLGLFEFTKMPFGLTSAPATFQRLMDCVLSGLAGLVCLVFLDDVIIFTKTTAEQHMYDLLRVLRTIMAVGLKVKGRKCKVARKILQFLGHLVSADGISPDPEKVKAIAECLPPKNVHEVRVFLGLVGFYRKFIENCAMICACITKLLQKDEPFEWTKSCQKAFDACKELLSTAPILAYPDLTKQFVLYTDASGVGLGSVLAQVGDDGREHVISYASRTLRRYEVRYGITELEMLAIVWSMGHYRTYLLGTETKIVTDHKANHWILHKKKPKCAVSMRLTRWAILLQEYDYIVEYRPGRKLRNADALSRPPIVQHSKDLKDYDFDPETWNVRGDEEGTDEIGLLVTKKAAEPAELQAEVMAVTTTEDDPAFDEDADYVATIEEVAALSSFSFASVTNEQLREEQLTDPDCEAMIRYIEDKVEPEDENVGLYVGRASRWHSVNDGVLYHIVKRRRTAEPDPAYEPTEQLVVPAHMKEALIASYHSGKLAGHLGHDKIFHTIARKYYWRNCYDDIRKHCQECVICARYNQGSRRKTRLYPTEVTEPFYRVFVDFEGPMTESTTGNKYILVFIDSFTKFPICVATKDQTAETAAEALIKYVVLEHGCPTEVLSDQGPAFASDVCRRVCEGLGIKKTYSTPYHAPTMGQVENMNKTVLAMLRKMLDGEDDKWDEQLPYAVFAYRSAVHASMKDSPFHAVYGRDPIHPHDLLVMPEIPADDPPFAKDVQERMSRAWTSIRENLYVSKDKMAEYYNRNVVNNRVKVGDNVVKQIFVHKGRNRKCVPTFEAMYRVLAMDPPNVTILKWGEPVTKKHVVHENLVKVYKGTWIEPPIHPAAKRQVKARKAFLKKKYNCSKCYKRNLPGGEEGAISWVQCDYCRGWFHWQCVGLKQKPRALNWFCPECKKKGVLREGDPLDGYEPDDEQAEELADDDDTHDDNPRRPGTSGKRRPVPPIKVRRAKKRGGPIETDSEAERELAENFDGAGAESDASDSTIDA